VVDFTAVAVADFTAVEAAEAVVNSRAGFGRLAFNP
jgi:hypothetical protein